MATTSAATAVALSARELADAEARTPCPGLIEDRSIAGEAQVGTATRLDAEADDTGVFGRASGEVPGRVLPWSRNVLAVIARPGRESADLGALLYAFRRRGARLALLSLTRGEASPLNSDLRAAGDHPALRAASRGRASGHLVGHGGRLPRRRPSPRSGARAHREVRRAIRSHAPDLLLVVDPATAGDPDDAWAAKAACLAAAPAGLPVLARTAPGARGGWVIELGTDAAAGRAIQRCAAGAHASQSAAGPQVRRHLDLLGTRERLRWLIPPAPDARTPEAEEPTAAAPPTG